MPKCFLLAAFLTFIQIKRDCGDGVCKFHNLAECVRRESVCNREGWERERIRPTEIRGVASLNMLMSTVTPNAIG